MTPIEFVLEKVHQQVAPLEHVFILTCGMDKNGVLAVKAFFDGQPDLGSGNIPESFQLGMGVCQAMQEAIGDPEEEDGDDDEDRSIN